MGNHNTKYITELSDDSSEDELDYSPEPRSNLRPSFTRTHSTSQMNNNEDVIKLAPDIDHDGLSTNGDGINRDLTTDAFVRGFLKPETILTMDKVYEIEQELDIYEIISLVYLLYEDAHYALQELMLLLRGAQKNLIYNWAAKENNSGTQWQKKLVEALCIIKNYGVLRDLGYKKQDLIAEFLPRRVSGTSSINKVKKAIYLVCEQLNKTQTAKFLLIVKSQFEECNLHFENYNPEYLELYFLKWETLNYLSLTDVTNIRRTLKVMNEDHLYDLLDVGVPQVAPNATLVEKPPPVQMKDDLKKPARMGRASTSTDTQQDVTIERLFGLEEYQLSPPCLSSENSLSPRPSLGRDDADPSLLLDNNRYKIDPDNPGILLIINQEYFYTEFDPKFKHLLPNDVNVKLEKREGTEVDKEALESIFRRFGFKVIIADNLVHEDMVGKIKEVVKSVQNESSLFVCIMSHGDKGVVYGSNSCKVKVSEIQKMMCKLNKQNLVDKPKILILQSCQGRECQKIEEVSEDEEEREAENTVTTDGPKYILHTVDMLTFWATVPGYAAIRNKRLGSWFIQALCEKINELGNRNHFADICTRIVNSVSGKTWINEVDKKAMTPMVESTLRRDFYFPPMRN